MDIMFLSIVEPFFRFLEEVINRPLPIVMVVFCTVISIIMLLISGKTDISTRLLKFVPDPSERIANTLAKGSILIFILGLIIAGGMYWSQNPGNGASTPIGDNSKIENVQVDFFFQSDEPIPASDTGIITERQCPVVLEIRAQITVESQTEQVTYRWVQDSIPTNERRVSFEQRLTKTVHYNETFGENGGRESHTYRLEIIAPPEYDYKTDRRTIEVKCIDSS